MAESYGISETNLTIDKLFGGSHPPVEIPVTLKSGAGSLLRGALLGRRNSDGKYAPIDPGTRYDNEDIGNGNGSTKTVSGTLVHPGVKPGSLAIHSVVVGDAIETFSDNGDGTLTSDGATPGAGTIDYASGAFSVTFFVAPKNGVDVYADYIGALDAETAEAIGTGDGTEKEWEGFLDATKVVPHSVYFYTNDTTPLTLHDDGDGNLTGDDGAGTINYDTGEYYIEFDTAPANTKTIKADYCTYDGTEILRAILSRDADATSADVKVAAYVHGEFNRSGVVWPTISETQKDEIVRDAQDRGIFIKARIV